MNIQIRNVSDTFDSYRILPKDYRNYDEINQIEIKFLTYLTSWKNRIELSLTPTTYYQYCLYINNYLDPTFGHLYISEIQTRLIQDFIFSLVNSGVGTRTIRLIYQVFRHILDDSQKEGLIPANPAVGIKLPKYKHQEMKVFTEDQVRTFLQSIHGQADEALFYLAVATGLRQSELIALKWSDLSVSNQTIRVERQLKRHYLGTDFFTQPKTKNGIRIIQVGRKAVELLNRHKVKQGIHKAQFDSEWQEFDLIFPSVTGLPMRQFSIYKRFIHIIDQAKLPRIRFHDLRHTAASIMLNHNIPMIVVSRRLGHYKVSFTIDTYGHLMPEMQEKAAELMDSFLD